MLGPLGRAQRNKLAMELEMHQIESSEEQTPKWDYIRDMQEISWGNTLWGEKGRKPVGGGENCQITVQCERKRKGRGAG